MVEYLPHHSSKQFQTKLVHPYSLKAFQTYQEHGIKQSDLGDLSVTNKTNYLA
jgi:hypothetical protein